MSHTKIQKVFVRFGFCVSHGIMVTKAAQIDKGCAETKKQ